jgi:UDP-glucose 4-epimerase
MRTLVTGGAGFIGSNLVDALVARGDEVVVCDDLSSGREQNLATAISAGARLERLDVCDALRLRAVCEAHSPEVVFHLAAQIDVRRSVSEPAADARINVEGTINALTAAQAGGARKLVLASTGGAIYGDASVIPTPESAPARPLAPYGQAKLAAEGYCRVWSELHDLDAVSLRFANVYGPRQDPGGEGGVVAIFSAAAREQRPYVIFGEGTQTRDFVYVGDVVEAMLLAGDHDPGADPLNIATGRETSVLDLVEACATAGPGSSERAVVTHQPPRAGEVDRSCLDPSAARALLGWEARTSLGDGIATTYAALADGATREV